MNSNKNIEIFILMKNCLVDRKDENSVESNNGAATVGQAVGLERMPSTLTANGDLSNHNRRNQALQIDLHKVLCFWSIPNTSDCCQCLPEDNAEPTARKSSRDKEQSRLQSQKPGPFLVANRRVHHPSKANTSNNWQSKYCGYYFLMITAAQAQLNTSLLFQFLNNIKFSSGESRLDWTITNDSLVNSSQGVSNFTRFSLNNVNYYILNDWLDNQTVASFNHTNHTNSSTESRSNRAADLVDSGNNNDSETGENIGSTKRETIPKVM